ncbi:hypothetical protein TNCT_438841 [Trichonephila clavata]|uniref:Uncharacterized protein n=1 Tax=Trichonephila clavata TaxID=2740835 RepID=A0A8X6LJI8_TRICU|nr:hypothetical protein TNCT_438841 [Trichonephila clavata]
MQKWKKIIKRNPGNPNVSARSRFSFVKSINFLSRRCSKIVPSVKKIHSHEIIWKTGEKKRLCCLRRLEIYYACSYRRKNSSSWKMDGVILRTPLSFVTPWSLGGRSTQDDLGLLQAMGQQKRDGQYGISVRPIYRGHH